MLRRFTVLCVICSLLLIPAGTLWGQEKQEVEQELQQLHRRLDELQSRLKQTRSEAEETRGKLEQTETRETSLLSLVERYSNNISSGKKNLERWKQLEQEAEEKINQVESNIEELESKIDRRKELLRKRLRAIYKQGEIPQAQILIGSESMSDFLTRARYFRNILKHDRELVNSYRQDRQELVNLRSQQKNLLERRRTIRKREQNWLEYMEKLKEEQRKVLAEIRNRKVFFKRRYQELQKQQSRVQELVIKLQQERKEKQSILDQLSNEFGRSRGDLPWPVESRKICRPFGEWEERGLVHQNDGIDICTDEGTAVTAVASGKVLVARTFRGMGKIVILGHGGQYTTLYGSLVKLAVETGDQVNEGQQLGRAGQTSGMDEPRLYFQMFEEREILNPLNWLRDR